MAKKFPARYADSNQSQERQSSRLSSYVVDERERTLLELAVEYRSIESIRPHPKSAHTHKNSQLRRLEKSIRTFGVMRPILVDAEGNIIDGLAIWLVAKRIGLATIPVICLKHLTPDLVRAAMIALNKIAEDSGWDSKILKTELEYLISIPDFDVAVTGFEIAEIDNLILDTSDSASDPQDCLPPLETVTITKPGDLWILEPHRVYCGDCRHAESYEILMNGARAALVLTDPPFNVKIDGHVCGNGKNHHPEFAMASGEMTEDEFVEFLEVCLRHLARWSVDGAVHYVAIDWGHTWELLTAARRVYNSMLNLCVWTKDNGGMGSYYRSQHELFFVFKVGKGPAKNNIQLGKFGRYRTNVWKYPGANTLSRIGSEGNLLEIHPTVKPINLVADALLDSSARKDIVLDAFLGSGTTLLAAERTGRICHGIEIEPRYVDLAIRRWQQITGEKAVHAVTGETFDSKVREEACDGR